MPIFLVLLIFSFAVLACPANSQTSATNLGLHPYAGQTNFFGDFSRDANRPLYGFGLVGQYFDTNDQSKFFGLIKKVSGILGVDFFNTSTTYKGTEYPFNSGNSVSLQLLTIVLGPCFYTANELFLCTETGWGQLTIREDSRTNVQSYGVWDRKWRIGKAFDSGLNLGFSGHYVTVEQYVSGEKALLGLLSVALSVGYDFSRQQVQKIRAKAEEL